LATLKGKSLFLLAFLFAPGWFAVVNVGLLADVVGAFCG
jgi:hypothetical protein